MGRHLAAKEPLMKPNAEQDYQPPQPQAGSQMWIGQRQRFIFPVLLLGMLLGLALQIGVGVGMLVVIVATVILSSNPVVIAGVGAVVLCMVAGLLVWYLPWIMGHSHLHSYLARVGARFFAGEPVTVLPGQVRLKPRRTPDYFRLIEDADDVGGLAIYPTYLHFHGDWLDMVVQRDDLLGPLQFRADRIGLYLVKNCVKLQVAGLADVEELEFSIVDAYSLKRFLRKARHAESALRAWEDAGVTRDG